MFDANPDSSPQPSTLRMGRRVYRAIAFALLVGLAGAALSAVPSLFVQSVFVVENERCLEAQQQDIAATGSVQTTCGEALADAPVWLPLVVVIGGAAMGAAGGFGYGFISPKSAPRFKGPADLPWLPF
ncbi:MAG: hypothetical protein WD645_07135 [Dehalococcoidia bacterium]